MNSLKIIRWRVLIYEFADMDKKLDVNEYEKILLILNVKLEVNA